MKRISIVMCTYNGAGYLREQIDSLLRQTYPFYELIVQDDHSTDRTPDIVHEYQTRHPERNIQLFINPEQLGYNRNFLTAFQHAEGDYIACCDQDDIWTDNKLEVLMQKIGPCSLIFHNSILMDNRHRELGLLHRRPLPEEIAPLEAALYPRSYGHQILFRRDVAKLMKPFLAYQVSYDYLTFTLAGSLAPVRYTHTPLVYWRRHETAATYNPQQPSVGKWDGYVRALKALRLPRNRETSRRYFALLSRVPFRDRTAMKAVRLMGKGDLRSIFCTCLICLLHSRETAPGTRGLTRLARAFFLPLYFIRDHGRYIIR